MSYWDTVHVDYNVPDGLALMYAKSEICYPVILSKEQSRFLETLPLNFPGPLRIAMDRPIGKAIKITGMGEK